MNGFLLPHCALRVVKADRLWPDRIRNQSGMWNGNWTKGEPVLSQMLNDPIIQDVMRSDKVSRHEIGQLFAASSALNPRAAH